MTISLGALIGGIGIVFGVVMGYLNYRKTDTKDIQRGAAGDAELRTDIKYIARGVDEIRLEQKAQEKRHSELAERVTRVEESTKSAHHRIDGLERKEKEE